MERDLKNIQWGEFEIGQIFKVFTGNLLAKELLKKYNMCKIKSEIDDFDQSCIIIFLYENLEVTKE